jgi:outer membrane lipoprotein-sorting protein
MVLRRVSALIVLFCLASMGLSSCFVRRRLVNRTGGRVKQALLVADRATLLRIISKEHDSIHDFSATVDMTPALGTTEKNKVTEYKDVRGYIRFRKPAEIRIIGLYPVVRNKMFDMLSTGTDFRLYIPAQNRFLTGQNEIEQPSPNKLYNLRPQHFLDAMLVRPIDTQTNQVLLENFTDEDNAFYILYEVHPNSEGHLQLRRTIWIDRLELDIARQLIFDDSGNILTDARYSEWKVYDNVPFPKHLEINRPRDEYAVVIDIVKMDINKGVPEDLFTLPQPEGSKLQVIGPQPAPEAPKPKPPQGPRT